MTRVKSHPDLLSQLDHLNAQELRRLLAEHLTRQKLGLYWERNAIEHDQALNANVVLPRLVPDWSHTPEGCTEHRNLIIEGDNFDSLRLLRSTHAGKVRVIYIDPPYNTGNKDWAYNDRYVGENDRWRHSQWLEFIYRRLILARDLLTSDGVILVSINDENRAVLELLMDGVFPGRRIGSLVWRTRQGSMDAKGGFSADHEHVLVYANPGFTFRGSERDETKYANPDNDPRGAWGSQMLIKSHNAKERPEAYYSIRNPETDTWYLCDPDSVWRFSSTTRPLKKKKLQADPIETIITEKRVLWPANEQTIIYESEGALFGAVMAGTAPKEFRIYAQIPELKKLAKNDDKVARLLTYIEPLENWVGRKLGYGRPRYKRFRDSLKRDANPLSSWLQFASDGPDDEEYDDSVVLKSGGTSEGTSLVRQILGNKDFQYPKPLSLLKGLFAQASRPDDLILDFFAGSGTTGHAVLELNAEDGGSRRFILCSSTEATIKAPNKNLCHDVCAERIRRVMQGHGGKPGYTLAQSGEFAYLQLDKFDLADVALDAAPEHAATLLALRHAAAVPVAHAQSEVRIVAKGADWLLVLCPSVNAEVMGNLCALPAQHGVARLVVYAPRPKALAGLLADRGVEAQVHALHHALTQGQGGRQ